MASTLVPVATIAKILNLTPTRVQQLAKDGIIPKSSHGQYELIGTVTNYIKYLQERVPGGGGSKTSADISTERARLLKAQADMVEIELAEKNGELVSVSDVEADWMGMVNACRSKLLAIPTKSAYQIAHLNDSHEIEKYLKRTVYEALEELATYEPKDTAELPSNDDESDSSMGTATGIDGESVGGSIQEAEC